MDNYQMVVGSKACPLRKVFLIVEQSSAIKNYWSIFAIQLDVPGAEITRFRNDFLLNKLTLGDVIYGILEIWIARKASEATLVNLLHIVEGQCGANDVGELLRLEYKLPCKPNLKDAYGNPLTKWKDLSPAFKMRVIEIFQHFAPNLKYAKILQKLSSAALVSLMRGKKPPLLSFPEELSYYVSRTIVTRNIISDKIFDQYSSDIFLFTGMDRYELSVLAKKKLTGRSRDQLNLAIKFMILDQENHFERICGKTEYPVHLLRKEENGKLRWIKSKGEMKTLLRCIDQEQDELDEGQFCDICATESIAVLICDTPGMGKSVLLTQIGHRLLQLNPDRTTVLFIELSEFIKHAKSFLAEGELKMIELTLQNWTGESLSKYKLDSKTVSIELLLDGYDEVESPDRKLALEMFETIRKSFKFLRLWITSRPHLSDELENTLNILGCNVRPFHEENQIHFLSSYWSRKVKLDEEKVKLFAKLCLKSLKATMNSTDNDIAGIPLQCLLIGEVFEDDAVEYAKVGEENVISSALEIEIGTITNLYCQLVKIKFEKYKSAFGNAKWGDDNLMTIHSHLSLELLFPVEHGLLKLTKACEIDNNELMNAGIITSTQIGGVTFLHRTFAEYFVAWFIFDKLEKEKEWSPELTELFSNILQCIKSENQNQTIFTHFVICYFLNTMIADSQVEISQNSLSFKFVDWNQKFIEDIALACMNGKFVSIFKFFDDQGLFNKLSGDIFNVKLLLFAIRNSNMELLKSVLAHFERHHNFDLEVQKATLREGVKHGKFSILEFLIKVKGLSSLVENFDGNTNLVCDCVEGTLNCSEEEIIEKMLVLQMLVGIKGSLVDGLNGSSETAPLLCAEAHVKLLIELLRLGANVLVQDAKSGTVLHLGRNFYHHTLETRLGFGKVREDFHKLVMSIPTNHLTKLVQMKGGYEESYPDTALMSILRRIDPLPETLDTFHRVGADFNHVIRGHSVSVLAVAISNGRSAKTIQQLIRLGADVHQTQWQRNTPLHLAAQIHRTSLSFCDRYSIIQHLLENGCNPSALNKDEKTPYHLFLKKEYMDYKIYQLFKTVFDERSMWTPTMAELTLWYAVRDGDAYSDQDFEALAIECEAHRADFNWKDGNADTLLHLAIQNWKTRTVMHLLRKGVNVNSKNQIGVSPIHYAARSNQNTSLEVIMGLIEAGANPMEVTDNGQNILHFAALGTAGVLKYLLEWGGADVNKKDSNGNTPLHWLFDDKINRSGNKQEKCILFIQHGADVNISGYWGKTPQEMEMEHPDKDKQVIELLRQASANASKTNQNKICVLN